jgi:hypothetical protein
MHRQFLLSLLSRRRSAPIQGLARAALEGDAGVLPFLWDYLHECGERAMQSLRVGECYLIRTTAYTYTGRVRSVSFTDVVLGEAAWIPATGGYHEALRTGNLAAVEPYPDEVILSTAAIVDAARWEHKLPREAKGSALMVGDDEIPF